MYISIVRGVFVIYPHIVSRDDSTAFFKRFVAIIHIGLFAFILVAVRAQNAAMFNIYNNIQYGENTKHVLYKNFLNKYFL
jgi:hypothetical protein